MNQTGSLSAEYVDLYTIQLDLPQSEITDYLQWLSEAERARASKLLSSAKSREFIMTRSSLKRILSQALNESAENIVIANEPGGKPYLDCSNRHPRVRFSVSHSYDLALVALTLDHAIGVDVEKIREEIDYTSLSRRFFSSAEFEAIQRCDPALRLRAFFATWTRKEALVKAHGKGIALGLQQFDVSVDPDKPPSVLATRWDSADSVDWHLHNIETDNNYMASLATGSPLILRYR